MRRRLAFLAMSAGSLVPLLVYGWSNPAGSGGVEQEIRRLEEQRSEAVLHNDTTTLDRLYSADMTTIDRDGGFHTNATKAAVRLNADGTRKVTTWMADEMLIRVYGDAAVVTQRAQMTDVLRGQSRSFSTRLTHVWINRDGQWQLVARHASSIAAH